MTTTTTKAFFTNPKTGQPQGTVFHSTLAQHRDLMVKFLKTPSESQFPTAGTTGLVMQFQVPDDDQRYYLAIENDAIAKQLGEVDLEQWHRVTATGGRDEAALEIYPIAPFELDEGEPQPAQPAAAAPQQPAAVTVESPKVTPSHTQCTAITLEAITALQAAGINLDTSAVSTIYNTHFMALTRQGIVL
tara:strand:- start:704 stop:1270 length:567 start_codon:yes stop_codon:yes gene_type:complete